MSFTGVIRKRCNVTDSIRKKELIEAITRAWYRLGDDKNFCDEFNRCNLLFMLSGYPGRVDRTRPGRRLECERALDF